MEAYNIGTGQGYSVLEVIREVEEVAGCQIPVRVASKRPGDPAVLCASPRKLIAELNWKPRSSDLKNIVRSAWEWKRSRALLAA